jgi:hypothetical protein
LTCSDFLVAPGTAAKRIPKPIMDGAAYTEKYRFWMLHDTRWYWVLIEVGM